MKAEEQVVYEKYGEFLRKKRKESGKSIKAISHEIGVKDSYLSQFERGKIKIPMLYFYEALRALGVKQIDLAELYGDAPAASAPAPEPEDEKTKMKRLLREILADEPEISGGEKS